MTRSLTDDIAPLLSTDLVYRNAETQEAFERVWFSLVARLRGEVDPEPASKPEDLNSRLVEIWESLLDKPADVGDWPLTGGDRADSCADEPVALGPRLAGRHGLD